MLFGVLVLIPKPRPSPLRLGVARAKDGIERNEAKPGQTGDPATQAMRKSRINVVKPENDDAPRLGQLRHGPKRGPRVWRVMQDTRAINDVESPRAQTGRAQIGLDEIHPPKVVTGRRRGAELERGAGEVGTDDDAIGGRQKEAHLPGAAPELDDPRVARDRLLQETREFVSRRPPA